MVTDLNEGWPDSPHPLNIEEFPSDMLSKISFLFGGVGDGEVLSLAVVVPHADVPLHKGATPMAPYLAFTVRTRHCRPRSKGHFPRISHCWTFMRVSWRGISAS